MKNKQSIRYGFGDSFMGIMMGLAIILMAIGGCFYLVTHAYLDYELKAIQEIPVEEFIIEDNIELL